MLNIRLTRRYIRDSESRHANSAARSRIVTRDSDICLIQTVIIELMPPAAHLLAALQAIFDLSPSISAGFLGGGGNAGHFVETETVFAFSPNCAGFEIIQFE